MDAPRMAQAVLTGAAQRAELPLGTPGAAQWGWKTLPRQASCARAPGTEDALLNMTLPCCEGCSSLAAASEGSFFQCMVDLHT